MDIGNLFSGLIGMIGTTIGFGVFWKWGDEFLFKLLVQHYPDKFEKITIIVFKELNVKIEEYKKKAPKTANALEKKLIDLSNKIETILKE